MKRFAVTSVLLGLLAFAPSAFAQAAKPAAPKKDVVPATSTPANTSVMASAQASARVLSGSAWACVWPWWLWLP